MFYRDSELCLRYSLAIDNKDVICVWVFENEYGKAPGKWMTNKKSFRKVICAINDYQDLFVNHILDLGQWLQDYFLIHKNSISFKHQKDNSIYLGDPSVCSLVLVIPENLFLGDENAVYQSQWCDDTDPIGHYISNRVIIHEYSSVRPTKAMIDSLYKINSDKLRLLGQKPSYNSIDFCYHVS